MSIINVEKDSCNQTSGWAFTGSEVGSNRNPSPASVHYPPISKAETLAYTGPGTSARLRRDFTQPFRAQELLYPGCVSGGWSIDGQHVVRRR